MPPFAPSTRQFVTPLSNAAIHFLQLPLELQAEIFIQCLPDFPQLFGDSDAPQVLLQVCRTWRNVAINTPRLWSAMTVDLWDGRLSFNKKRVLSILSLWLSRSKNLPLFIGVVYRPVPIYFQQPLESIVEDIIKSLLNVSYRWQFVHAVLPPQFLLPLTNGSPSYDFPLLRSLNFEVQGITDTNPAPFDIRALGVDWAHLTVLDLWSEYNALLTLDDWIQLLSETTGLTHCRFNAKCLWTGTQDDAMVTRISPLGLRNLDITFQGESDVHNPESALSVFMEQLEFPTLKRCHLAWQVRQQGVGSSDIIRGSLLRFLYGHRQSLEVLSLEYFPLHENHLIESFSGLSFLTSLTLKSSLEDGVRVPISDRTLQALALPASSHQKLILPYLQYLHIQCRGNTLSSKWLNDLIRSRRGTSLREVSFLLLEGVNEELVQDIEHWERKEIQLTLDLVTI